MDINFIRQRLWQGQGLRYHDIIFSYIYFFVEKWHCIDLHVWTTIKQMICWQVRGEFPIFPHLRTCTNIAVFIKLNSISFWGERTFPYSIQKLLMLIHQKILYRAPSLPLALTPHPFLLLLTPFPHLFPSSFPLSLTSSPSSFPLALQLVTTISKFVVRFWHFLK